MGYISKRLATRLNGDKRALQRLRSEIGKIHARTDWVPDPVHSAYVCAQNITSLFAEGVSPLPELKPYYEAAGTAEEEYMPQGPPFSPLTASYFTPWAFFDLRFGRDLETIGTILLDVSEQVGLSPASFAAVRQFQQSRMGLYEYCGISQGRHCLRELITGDEFACVVPAGYPGQPGQLWYVRLCPPIQGYDYHVVFNTPYVMVRTSKADWTAYLERAINGLAGDDTRTKLFRLLKFGRHTNGWNEFVFQAYMGHQSDAIFLAGLPDVPDSLPHGDMTGKRRCG